MAEMTLTIKGEPDELMRILTALADNADSATSAAFDPDRFTLQLTEAGRGAVVEVARVSALGGSILRRELLKKLGVDEQVLAGVFGGVGLHWKTSSSAPNPFRGRWDAAAGDFQYGIERDQANQILAALKLG